MNAGNATADLFNLTVTRLNKLNEILNLSGCRKSVCTSLLMMMPDVRSPNSSLVADKAVIKTATIKYVMIISGQKLNVLWNLLI